jgi:hypothetical protein
MVVILSIIADNCECTKIITITQPAKPKYPSSKARLAKQFYPVNVIAGKQWQTGHHKQVVTCIKLYTN